MKPAKPATPRPAKGPRTRPAAACDAAATAAADRATALAVARWFGERARDLPWRSTGPGKGRDPWRSLVSEVMLQQTQVSRVLERYEEFMRAFPTPAAMARAGEAAVLARWSGMGYYRRARMLFAAASEIVERFGGAVPRAAQELRTLPGVGRYTAGAVASIVFGACEPIVDGNVARVLLRVHGVEQSAQDGAAWCWERAGELARAAGKQVGAFNEGLMELGATVCTPRSPACGACPLAGSCEAKRRGRQDRIPRPKAAAKRAVVLCEVVVVRDRRGRVLLERRKAGGMWGGLWQAPTLERRDAETPRPAAEVLAALGLAGLRSEARPVEEFVHQTTHREVRFVVYEAAAGRASGGSGNGGEAPDGHGAGERRWVGPGEFAEIGLSNAQRRILGRQAGLFG